MAQYEHLPIYRQTYSLLLEAHNLLSICPKKFKFSLCNNVVDDLTCSLLLIIKINSKKEKSELLFDLILLFEKIKIQIRLLKSLDIISKKLYFKFSEEIVELLKQSEGWKKKYK